MSSVEELEKKAKVCRQDKINKDKIVNKIIK